MPLVVLIAGPNGAGKSTAASRLLRGALTVNEFVNADTIARGLSEFNPESVAFAAGRIMLARLKVLAESSEDFALETTLAGRNYAPWLKTLRAGGYRAHAFLSLPAPEMALARVAERVLRGGHHVPDEVVRRRYASGLRNFFTLYRRVVDSWQMYDNSGATPRLLAEQGPDRPAAVYDESAWTNLLGRQR